MAVDIVSVCTVAASNQSSQTLAIVLSILFSVYTVVSIFLSALTIYTSSQAFPTPSPASNVPEKVAPNTVFVAHAGGEVPLMSLHPGR